MCDDVMVSAGQHGKMKMWRMGEAFICVILRRMTEHSGSRLVLEHMFCKCMQKCWRAAAPSPELDGPMAGLSPGSFTYGGLVRVEAMHAQSLSLAPAPLPAGLLLFSVVPGERGGFLRAGEGGGVNWARCLSAAAAWGQCAPQREGVPASPGRPGELLTHLPKACLAALGRGPASGGPGGGGGGHLPRLAAVLCLSLGLLSPVFPLRPVW